MPETSEHPYNIVVAVDLSSISEAVIEHALDTVSRHARVEVHVITVVPTTSSFFQRTRPDHAEELAVAERTLRSRFTETASAFLRSPDHLAHWRVRLHIRVGEPAEEIVALTDEVDADLVVMGQHGWGGQRHRLVGSVSERVTRTTHCSVLLVQPAAHEARARAAEQPCAECADTRRHSDGETWFCAAHRDERRERALTSLVPWAALSTRPGGIY